VPKALAIDPQPRRRARSKPVEADQATERGLLLRILLRSPRDLIAGGVALAAVVAIVTNAMVLQPGRHPAPMFNSVFPADVVAVVPSAASPSPLPRPRPVEVELKPVELKSADPAAVVAKAVPSPQSAGPASTAMRPPAPIPSRNDPVGDLIVSTRRVAAVQRALTDFGYGQLKTTGVAGTDTQAAIQKFERDRKLPVTGHVSDRLVRELGVVTGRAID
jgi:hypothetical protein